MHYKKYLLLFLILSSHLFGNAWFQKDSTEINIEEEVYLSFRYQGVIDEIVVAYYADGRFFLPLTELFDLFAINYNLDPSSFSVSGYYLRDDNTYLLDFSRRFAMLKKEVWSISANDFLVKEVDFFVAPEVYSEVFGLEMAVDLSRLTLQLKTLHELPIIARHTRRHKEELRQKYTADSDFASYELLSGRDKTLLDGAFFDYTIFSTISESNTSANLNLSMGGELLNGDIQGTMISQRNQGNSAVNYSDIKWRYVDESQPWFSTITVGQQSTSGLITQTFQGAQVSNQPLVPRRSYDTYAIDGTTEPEAEVELYQNNRLVEMIRADDVGYYRFMVPLNYGISDYKIRIYAKQGRTIDLDRRVQIPFNFLPVNEVRYSVSAGRLASEALYWRDQREVANAQVDIGVKNWLTAGLGMEYIQKNNRDIPAIYGKLSSRVAGDVLVGLDAVFDNYYRLSIRGVGANSSSLFSEYIYYNQQNLYNIQGYKHNFTTNLFYPFEISEMRFTTQGSISWINLGAENRYRLSADINQFIRGFRIRYGLREDHSFIASNHANSSKIQLGAMYTIPRSLSIHQLLRGSYFRSDMSYSTSTGNFENVQFQYIKQINKQLKGQLQVTYNLLESSAFIEAGVSWDLDALRSTTSIRSIRGTPSFSQTIRGSAGLDRSNNQILWDNRQQVGRSGLSIRMFIDENNSGNYDSGEEIIPGNAISIIGSSSRQIAKSGIYRMTQLQPYRRYNFRVNEARINNPMLVASKRKFSVVTDPNRYKQLDIAFFTTGVIDGRVDRIKEGEFVPISGLRIHVKAINRDFETTLRTFADGSYYSMEIPPGDYEIWVDESQLEFLGMDSKPERLLFTIEANEEGDYVEKLDFLLE